jgi:hypothetical protein
LDVANVVDTARGDGARVEAEYCRQDFTVAVRRAAGAEAGAKVGALDADAASTPAIALGVEAVKLILGASREAAVPNWRYRVVSVDPEVSAELAADPDLTLSGVDV